MDCTTCGYVLRPHRDLAGRIVVCPACEARLIVPPAPTPVEPSPNVSKTRTVGDLFTDSTFQWVT